MFNCIICGKMYVCKADLLKHANTHDASSISCDICYKMFTYQDNLSGHIRNAYDSVNHIYRCHNTTQMGASLLPIGHSTVIQWTPPAPIPYAQQQAKEPLTVAATRYGHPTTPPRSPALYNSSDITTTSTATVYGWASSLMPQSYSENSVENKIQKNSIQSMNTTGFIEVNSSLRRKTVWYLRKNVDNITNYRDFLHSLESELIEKLHECVSVHPIKYDLELEATYIIPTEIENISENRTFNSPARQLFVYSNVVGLVDCDFTLLLAKEETYAGKDRRFALSYIGGLVLGVHQYNPPISCRGSYLTLPENIINRRAVINPQNIDEQSFKWAILVKHVSKYRNRVSTNYFNEEHRYDFSVLSFPTTVSEIKLFERANPGTSVNIYGVKPNEKNKNEKSSTQLMVYPLRVTEEEMPNHFDLLLTTGSENKNHYTYISNFSRLVSSQINKGHRRLIFCKKCFKTFDFQPRKYKLHGDEALAQHRLIGKCVFNPNTALQPLSSHS